MSYYIEKCIIAIHIFFNSTCPFYIVLRGVGKVFALF